MSRGGRGLLAAALLAGSAAGLGLFTFVYAKGYSYLTNDPRACANCHIMSEHYAAWIKASHRAVATCNDCHTPHSFATKYYVKAKNGFWHSFYFTIGGFPDPLRITPANRRVTEAACRNCHSEITGAIEGTGASSVATHQAAILPVAAQRGDRSRLSCIRCHAHVGHWVR